MLTIQIYFPGTQHSQAGGQPFGSRQGSPLALGRAAGCVLGPQKLCDVL